MTNTNLTYPHDYRVICNSSARPIVVGGQAVNLWSITFLASGDPQLAARSYGSADLDVLSSEAVVDFLKNLPDWRFQKPPLWAFGTGLAGTASHLSADGRMLLCEVIQTVPGLSSKDLSAVVCVRHCGALYNVLDPIAILKAKAHCVEKYDQSQRQDRYHLKLIAKCVPSFLRQIHANAVTPEQQAAAAKLVSRAFEVATDPRITTILRKEGIGPGSLIPLELASSPIEKIRKACSHQIPRIPA